jgi:hypothetical protein
MIDQDVKRRGARILMVVQIFGSDQQYQKRTQQTKERHRKRKNDIDRRYRYQEI